MANFVAKSNAQSAAKVVWNGALSCVRARVKLARTIVFEFRGWPIICIMRFERCQTTLKPVGNC